MCQKQWQQALSLLSEMWGARVAPDVVSFNVGISACQKGGHWQGAFALLSKMREAKAVPDVISYSTGIAACAKAKQWQKALALLIEMRDAKVQPNGVYTTIPGSVRASSDRVARGGSPRPGGGPRRPPALPGRP